MKYKKKNSQVLFIEFQQNMRSFYIREINLRQNTSSGESCYCSPSTLKELPSCYFLPHPSPPLSFACCLLLDNRSLTPT